MLAGTLPLALGIGEAAQYRQSMAWSHGGLIISTLITRIVGAAVFEYVDRFREAIEGTFRPKAAVAGSVKDAFGNGVQFTPAVELPPARG